MSVVKLTEIFQGIQKSNSQSLMTVSVAANLSFGHKRQNEKCFPQATYKMLRSWSVIICQICLKFSKEHEENKFRS